MLNAFSGKIGLNFFMEIFFKNSNLLRIRQNFLLTNDALIIKLM